MDPRHLDALAKRLGTLGSRRSALGGILAGVLLPLEAAARGKGKHNQKRKGHHKDTGKDRKGQGKGGDKGKGKGKDQRSRTNAQAEVCWRVGVCSPKKGANVSQCDLAGYSPSTTLDCTGCNISRANLRGANLTGANLTKANLSGACLVNANLSGATTTNTTNLYNAIFCRTVMPDGSTNNANCAGGTACCPTCIAAGTACGAGIGGSCCGGQCTNGVCSSCPPTTCVAQGKNCGQIPDGCGRILDCGACTPPQTCGGGGTANICGCTTGTCQSLNACGANVPDGCGGFLTCGTCGLTSTPTCNNGTCTSCSTVCPSCGSCANLTDGTTRCNNGGVLRCTPCTTNAQCNAGDVCVSVMTASADGQNFSIPGECGLSSVGACVTLFRC